ncbi:MAG: restriction endonuclease subunit S, partial [Cetobacterium sp.]
SEVDIKIEKLEKKKELLSQYKKGMMQKLFSQKLRFKDENGNDYPDWKGKKLGDFLIKYSEIAMEHNQYPVLTSSRKGIFLQKDYFAGEDVASKDTTGYNVVPKGYFTYRHMSDDLIFKFNINTIVEKGIVSTLYPVFTTKNINSIFLQLKLNEGIEFKQFAILQKQGGSRTYMYFSKLEKLELNIPSISEQEKIANFLSSIDKKIELVEKELERNKEFKNGLLQKMFV